MAEILLSLTIIGVVAAITLPSLTGNINERTWNTQRKALYARMSQAIALMPALNGYGTLNDTEDTAAETFVTEGLSKVLKINNICDSEHLADCGIASNITTFGGNNLTNFITSYNTLGKLNEMFVNYHSASGYAESYSQKDTKATAFETANGESILVYYNPYCAGDMGETWRVLVQPKVCANFIYDLNGNKGPNTVGKDIGVITAFYPTDSIIVAPVLVSGQSAFLTAYEAVSYCKNLDTETRVPNVNELSSLFTNRLLFDLENTGYWSSSITSSTNGQYAGYAWSVSIDNGAKFPHPRNSTRRVRCVKR